MGVFSLYQRSRSVRLFVFVLLGIIIVTLGGCQETHIAYGFPTVHFEIIQGKDNTTQNFYNDNFFINLISMVLLFLIIEQIKKLKFMKKSIDYLDGAVFLVLTYFLVTSFLNNLIIDAKKDSLMFIVAFTLGTYLGIGLKFLEVIFKVLDKIAPAAATWANSFLDSPILSKFFPHQEDFFIRLGMVLFGIALFVIVYFLLKLSAWKPKK